MSNEHDLVYYLVTGFTEEQFEHENEDVRRGAYDKFNWPEKAKNDDYVKMDGDSIKEWGKKK